jgi:hypothetical protein
MFNQSTIDSRTAADIKMYEDYLNTLEAKREATELAAQEAAEEYRSTYAFIASLSSDTANVDDVPSHVLDTLIARKEAESREEECHQEAAESAYYNSLELAYYNSLEFEARVEASIDASIAEYEAELVREESEAESEYEATYADDVLEQLGL